MKSYTISLIVLLCFYQPVSAKIINGFLHEKVKLEREINDLLKISNSILEKNELRRYDRKLKLLGKKYETISQKFEETNQLLLEFYRIDPKLYDRVSKVTDAEGTVNHVYVSLVDVQDKEYKYLSSSHFKASAYTTVGQWERNPNACKSKYGAYSVSIVIRKGCNVNFALAHEFAHVLYIVPNLSEYADFYVNNHSQIINKHNKGHSPYDPGLAFTDKIEDSFRGNYQDYLNEMTLKGKDENLLVHKENNYIIKMNEEY